MAFAQDRYQLGALRGPQWRQTPLNGIMIAGAGTKSLQLVAGAGPQRPSALVRVQAPTAARIGGRALARTA